jgi:hypothetical protein
MTLQAAGLVAVSRACGIGSGFNDGGNLRRRHARNWQKTGGRLGSARLPCDECPAHPSVQLAHQRSAPEVGAADRSPAGDHTRRPRPKRTFHMDAGAPIGGQVIENLPEMPNTVELVVEMILIW